MKLQCVIASKTDVIGNGGGGRATPCSKCLSRRYLYSTEQLICAFMLLNQWHT